MTARMDTIKLNQVRTSISGVALSLVMTARLMIEQLTIERRILLHSRL